MNNFIFKDFNQNTFLKKNTGGIRTNGFLKKTLLNKPLISVIIVTHNSEKYLEECINSILNQKYKNYEIIIIDNKSKDKTLRIIKKYEKFIDFWISEKDEGIFDAMNKGIKYSKGEIIGFLNSDDIFFSKALLIVNKYLGVNKNIDYLFGTVLKKKLYSGFKPKLIRWKFNIYPSHSVGFFIKKKIHDKIGIYNTKYKHSNDYDFFYRLVKNKKFIGKRTLRNEILGKFREGGFSSNLKFFDRLFVELRIRFDNNQNLFDLVIIFFARCIWEVKNKLK